MKTSELTGQALNWAVAICQGDRPVMWYDYLREYANQVNYEGDLCQLLAQISNDPYILDGGVLYLLPEYCASWKAGGNCILSYEKICTVTEGEFWVAWLYDGERMTNIQHGPTKLIAGLRTLVNYLLGDEVTIPKELE